jgi:hypothetical protein
MRRVLVELHLDWVRPEVVEDSGVVTVRLGPNLDYEGIRGLIGTALTEEEWLEFRSIWCSDKTENRVFKILETGALRMQL